MIKYRADIDGLRAFAVLAVVIYHMFPKSFSGGFIGVDVFFIISGYLISSIIFQKLEVGKFSFTDFYVRRVNRIFPALFLVLVFVAFVGWFLLLPSELVELGKHIASGAGFISNISLFREVGYFNIASELKPLLHLWSLGIEEQFYFIWPVILLLAWKKKKHLTAVFCVLLIISFLLNILRISRHTDEVFFLLHTRFWELLMGAYLAFAESRGGLKQKIFQQKDVLSAIGAILALVGLFLLDGTKKFPGVWALFPTVSAFLLIAAGPSAFINKKILSSKWLVWIGLLSYPLYLWHWPLLSFGQIIYGDGFSSLQKISLMALALILSWITFNFVEKPIRLIHESAKKTLAVALTTAVFGVGGVGLLFFFEKIPSYSIKLGEGIQKISEATGDWDYPGRLVETKRKDQLRYREQGHGTKKIVFIGDSHMEQYYPRFENILPKYPDYRIVFLTRGGCPPLRNVKDGRDKMEPCPEHVRLAFREALKKEVTAVVLTASWNSYFSEGSLYFFENEDASLEYNKAGYKKALQDFQTVLTELRTAGKRVFLVLNIPTGNEFDPKRMIERSFSLEPVKIKPKYFTKKLFVEKYQVIKDDLIQVGKNSDVNVIDPVDQLCVSEVCPTINPAGNPFYKDTKHFRPFYVKESVTYLDQVFAI